MTTVKNKPTQVSAELKRLRMTARKVRLVCDLVRNLKPQKALAVLNNTPKKAAPIVSGLISSAIANAVNNLSATFDSLFIKELFVNEGRTLKRSRPRGRGSAFKILKRSSHIKVVIGIQTNQEGVK